MALLVAVAGDEGAEDGVAAGKGDLRHLAHWRKRCYFWLPALHLAVIAGFCMFCKISNMYDLFIVCIPKR